MRDGAQPSIPRSEVAGEPCSRSIIWRVEFHDAMSFPFTAFSNSIPRLTILPLGSLA
ncbi:MAG: hypothetical protein JWR69_413 [Pedosphaera sp.]|nr:hypothetical protein [Pedosphaera sp.]